MLFRIQSDHFTLVSNETRHTSMTLAEGKEIKR